MLFSVDELDAVLACAVALVVAYVATPVSGLIARRIGAVDQPSERGLADRPTPRLGGLALLAGILVAAIVFVPMETQTKGVLAGAIAVTAVGALDDVYDLPPAVKLLGQIGAALIPVLSDVRVETFTLPFVGRVDLGHLAGPVSVLWIVGVVNAVNLTDGIDGLAAGVCAISAIAFAVIAFDLGRPTAGVLAAIIAGSALGFLFHNFHPAAVFMGDAGSNVLGFMLAATAIQGTLKTNAVIALLFPLIILAVPFLDTSFVVAKRLKHRRPVYRADASHFHHRLSNIGFSQRRVVLYLYAWTMTMAGLAVALRFVPYSDDAGHLNEGWALVMGGLGLVTLAASVYLVYVLEILKFRRVRAWQLRRLRPDTSEMEIEEQVARELDTGEFEALGGVPEPRAGGRDHGTGEVPAVRS
jgi:UDP-GlcNAc:undecaprenyl-phosphate/decaprenyl-phosphate GlcNAc-1-phosphate transferase